MSDVNGGEALPAAPVEDAPDATEAAQPVDASPLPTPEQSTESTSPEAEPESSAEATESGSEPEQTAEVASEEPTSTPDGADQVSDEAPGADDAEEAPAV